MKGEWFEVKTAALLYLRGINANLEFHLGSNIEQARNFDDIVIKYRSRDVTDDDNTWRTCFIQLKHKERASLDASMLTTYDRGGFSLKKYLKSFCDIKNKVDTGRDHHLFDGPFETCDFVIYTNAPMVRSLAERGRRNVDIGPVHALLKTSQRNEVIVNFCEETDGDIYRDLEMSGGAVANEFLHKLKVFSGQPSEDKMDEVIKEELKVTCSDNMSDVDVIYRFFIEAVRQWWSEDEVNFLSHNSSLLEKALDQYKVFTISSHEKQMHRLNVKFTGAALTDLKEIFAANHSMCFISCMVETPAELGCTKVMQILREERGAYTFVGLECLAAKRQAVIHGWTTGTQPYLVVMCNGDSSAKHDELCGEICNVLRKNRDKHVVVVFGGLDEVLFTSTLKTAAIRTGVKVVETEECIELAQLDLDSMVRVMDSHVYLQSKKLTLRDVLREGVHGASDLIRRNLVEIMASTPVSLGRDLEVNFDMCTRRYLERRDVLSADVLKSDQVAGVIAVSNASLTRLQQMVSPGTRIGTLEESMKGTCRVVAIQTIRNAADGADTSGAEEDFYTLCERHDVVHWIRIEDDVIVWKRSKGDIKTVKPFVLQETCTASNPNSTLDLNDRILLIVEETSTQKPSLPTYLVMQTKKTHPYFWVLKINLHEHVDLLRDTKLEEADLASLLMAASCMDTSNRVEKEFLQFCLQHSKNVIVLMEHFHEIPEECQLSVVRLVKQLLRTSLFQVLITTSWSMKEMLEDSLCTIAYNTRELSLTRDVQNLLKL